MDRRNFEEMRKKQMKMRAAYGDVLNRAVTIYEDATRYPIEKLLELIQLETQLTRGPEEGQAAAKEKMIAAMDALKPLPNARERVYLWPEGKMPVETEYTDNSDHRYDHEPDYNPYYLEMLVPEWVTPRGAIVMVGGGTHTQGTVNEGIQVGTEFNALGYDYFILQCRPNGSPWNRKETAVDAARALRIIRSRAEEYRLDPNTIALLGFSNGGVTCDFCIEMFSGEQTVPAQFPDYVPDELDQLPGGPDAYLCVYGARHAGTDYDYNGVVYPPSFFAVGREDRAGWANLNLLYADLVERGVTVEVHTFPGNNHGGGGRKIIDGVGNPNFDLWVTHADYFMRDVYAKKD